MTDIEKLATQLEELNKNLKALMERMPGLAAGPHTISQPYVPPPARRDQTGYWPKEHEVVTWGARG